MLSHASRGRGSERSLVNGRWLLLIGQSRNLREGRLEDESVRIVHISHVILQVA